MKVALDTNIGAPGSDIGRTVPCARPQGHAPAGACACSRAELVRRVPSGRDLGHCHGQRHRSGIRPWPYELGFGCHGRVGGSRMSFASVGRPAGGFYVAWSHGDQPVCDGISSSAVGVTHGSRPVSLRLAIHPGGTGVPIAVPFGARFRERPFRACQAALLLGGTHGQTSQKAGFRPSCCGWRCAFKCFRVTTNRTEYYTIVGSSKHEPFQWNAENFSKALVSQADC